MGVKEATTTYVCDGCEKEETVSAQGRKDGFRPHLDMPVGWESIPTKEHNYLIVCYDCFQKQDDVSTLKVLAFTDDSGHSNVIDVTDPRTRVQVYLDILSEGRAYGDRVEKVKALRAKAEDVLKNSDATNIRLLTMAGNLIAALNDVDLDEIDGGRDGLAPFTPSTSWK